MPNTSNDPSIELINATNLLKEVLEEEYRARGRFNVAKAHLEEVICKAKVASERHTKAEKADEVALHG